MGISQIPQAIVPASLASTPPANDTAEVTTSQDTTSTTYTDLATLGPSVTVTTGTKALVLFVCSWHNGNTGAVQPKIDFAVSGATTRSASTTTQVIAPNIAIGAGGPLGRIVGWAVVTLTAGSNTFTVKYASSSGGTASFSNRQIFVMNLA